MATAAQVLIAARGRTAGLLLVAAVLVGAVAPLRAIGLHQGSEPALGLQAPAIWIYVLGLGLLVWRALGLLSDAAAERGGSRALGLLVPALFGAWLLYPWQVGVTGFAVPSGLLPSPEIGRAHVRTPVPNSHTVFLFL